MTWFIDLDGTLIDTGAYHKFLKREFIEKGDFSYLPSGKTIEARKRALEILCLAELPYYCQVIPEKPGAEDFLKKIKSTDPECKVYVLTGGPDEHARSALGRLGLLDYFDGIYSTWYLGGREGEVPGPYPQQSMPSLYVRLGRELGIPVEDIFVVDNDPAFLDAARNAGCQTFGIMDANYPQFTKEAFDKAWCDVVCTGFPELWDTLIEREFIKMAKETRIRRGGGVVINQSTEDFLHPGNKAARASQLRRMPIMELAKFLVGLTGYKESAWSQPTYLNLLKQESTPDREAAEQAAVQWLCEERTIEIL